MAHIVADTNVFYNLGAGNTTREQVAGAGDTLYYSPVSVLEITSKLSDRTFEQRKAAAKAILDSKAKLLLDPESHLTLLFGNQLTEEPFDWSQAVIATSQSPDFPTLLAGVSDYVGRVSRRVSVDVAGSWREVTEQQWVDDMLQIIADTIPRFRAWYNPAPKQRKGNKPRLTGERKAEFLAETKTEAWLTTLIKACQDRSFFKAHRAENFEPTAEFVKKLVSAADGVICYALLYTHYLIKLLTEDMLPQMNDSGDLELFLYATDDNHIIATSEKRWLDIAARADFQQRVRKV